MPLYELCDNRNNRCRMMLDEGAPSPSPDLTIAGRVFGALQDNSGAFVTDDATFAALTLLINNAKTPSPAPAS